MAEKPATEAPPHPTPEVRKKAPRSFWHHLRDALPVIVVVSLVTLGVEHAGGLRSFETAALDTWLHLTTSLEAQHVVIVGITDDDYRNTKLFNNTSPLKRSALQQVLKNIVLGNPRVIGVDLDTADGDPREGEPRESRDNSPPIVWAREAEISHDSIVEKLLPVLGQENPHNGETGLALLPLDWDGVVRRYRRVFRLNEHDRVASFPWAVATRYAVVSGLCEVGTPAGNTKRGDRSFCKTFGDMPTPEGDALEEPIVLNFSGERYRFPRLTAGQVLQAADGDAWAQHGPLTGKIVLLGGMYRAARDEHVTPVGVRTGVELMAQAIETELQGGGIRFANHLWILVLEILVGMVLVVLHYSFSLGWAVILSIVAIPVLTCLGSWLAFNTFALWASFIPIVVSVLIHQLYDHAKEYRRMHRELQARVVNQGKA